MTWQEFQNGVVGALQGVPDLTCAPAGPGQGLKSGDTFFGLIERGRLYFRVDDASRSACEEAGCGPLRVKGGLIEAYYEVPLEVREDPPLLRDWAARAIAVARRTAGPPPP